MPPRAAPGGGRARPPTGTRPQILGPLDLADAPPVTRAVATPRRQRTGPALAPVMTVDEVRQLQRDFVVLVHADGELETGFRRVPKTGPAAAAIRTSVEEWPSISSDLAALVGAINDNVHNFDALEDLDALRSRVGLFGAGRPPLAVARCGYGRSRTRGRGAAPPPKRRSDRSSAATAEHMKRDRFDRAAPG